MSADCCLDKMSLQILDGMPGILVQPLVTHPDGTVIALRNFSINTIYGQISSRNKIRHAPQIIS